MDRWTAILGDKAMTASRLSVKAIFSEALDIESGAHREEFLDRACSGDEDLRAEVEDLLSAVANAGSFMSGPIWSGEPTLDHPAKPEGPGQMLGPYKLRERLGEGGMGVVWAAEQKEPLRRKVAIKVIKPGMDSSQVIARFEAEREALSLMEHPNIARVLDAGSTELGRPYFVMELIHGLPITDYCDAQKLPIRQRLTLFIQVCRAVQHAHLKGVIHRDIKPSNVLVTEQDGEPVPKVIDFGVAKALHRPLTDRSIYTGVFQAVGTLTYMSPEQATLSQNDVDTRADVYGLGVLLYELLTGATPLDRDELEQGALDEALRMIREQDPMKPSTKVSSLGNKTEFVSQSRCVDARVLGKSIRGDLDWIVMKALEKDRKRRYETAGRFGDDLVRFLANEPAEACPPSSMYQTRKFLQRNKGFVSAVAAVLIVLVIGVVGMTGFSIWAMSEKNRAEEVSTSLIESFKREAVTSALAGEEESARGSLDLIRKAARFQEDYEYFQNIIEGLIAYHRAEYEAAEHFARTAISDSRVQEPSGQIAARALLARVLWNQGESKQFNREVGELRKVEPETDTDRLLTALAFVLHDPRHSHC
jgi:serine/threonine protein kinase